MLGVALGPQLEQIVDKVGRVHPLRPARRGGRRKRKKKKLPRGGTRHQRAYAKVTGLHCSSSSRSGASGEQVVQASTAALEATPFSVCVVADNWNGCTGEVTSDRHSGSAVAGSQVANGFLCPLHLRHSTFLALLCGFIWGVFNVVSAVKNQGLCCPCSALSFSLAVGLQLVLTSGGLAWPSLLSQWMSCPLHPGHSAFLAILRGVVRFITVVVSAVTSQGHRGPC